VPDERGRREAGSGGQPSRDPGSGAVVGQLVVAVGQVGAVEERHEPLRLPRCRPRVETRGGAQVGAG
jgi:hypothetical protein